MPPKFGLSGQGFGERLELEVLEQAGQAHLASDAGLLVATERAVGAVPEAAVHAHRPGADAAGDAQGTVTVGAVASSLAVLVVLLVVGLSLFTRAERTFMDTV